MKYILKRALALLLTACAFFAAPVPARAAGGVSKEEVVYATLNNDGTVRDTYVVNIFNLESDGVVMDYGAYSSVSNLSNTNPIGRAGDTTTVEAREGRFYYQGRLESAELPWTVSVLYSLNYAEIAAEDLLGKNGKIGIRIKTAKNTATDPTFYDNYMLQISLVLDAAKCVNISSADATFANAGGDKQLTFTVLPGKDADFIVTADVVDFSMEGISINAVPMSFSFDKPDTSEFTGDVRELQDAIGELNDGVSDLHSGAKQLNKGLSDLADGSRQFESGLDKAASGGGSLVSAAQVIDENLSDALDVLTDPKGGIAGLADAGTSLSGAGASLASAQTALSSLSGLSVPSGIPASLQALMGTDREAAQYVNALLVIAQNTGTAAAALGGAATDLGTALGALQTSLPALQADLSSIGTMVGTAEGYSDAFLPGLQSYVAGIKKAKDGYGELNDGIAAAADGISSLASGISKLSDGTQEMVDETADMDTKIDDAIDELIKDYDKSDYKPGSFASPKNQNVTSVQFVIRTAGVQPPEAEAAAQPNTEPTSLIERFLALFEGKQD